MSQRFRQSDRRQPVMCLTPGQRLLVLPTRGGRGLGPLAEDETAPSAKPLAEISGPALYASGPASRAAEAPRGFFLDRYIF